MRDLLQTPDPSEARKPRATALVVDRDATSRRFAEIALGRVGFAVETARDAAGAMETLQVDLIDLIVCDTDLDDMDGLTFFRKLLQEHRLRTIPFMFLSADPAVGAKAAALRAGVSDYLVKPCEVAEFVARAEALVQRQREVREALRARAFSLAGELTVVPFADIIALLELTRRSGVLSLFSSKISGRLYFEHGRVVHVECGNLLGEAAFFRLFREPSGHFEFSLEAAPPPQRTIHETASAMVLEAARLSDMEARHRPLIEDLPRAEATHRLVQRLPLRPPLRPDAAVSARFEMGIEEKFALGDLCLWTQESLSEWTRSDGGCERFHVHLVTDLPSGVSSMLSMAGAPSERWILDSMTDAKKAFGISFFLRRERVLDVLLVDARDPTAHLPALERVPSVMLICPPDGGLLALGSAARVGLEQLLETLAPPVVVGVGTEALSLGLMQLKPFREGSVLHTIGADRRDLRALLIEGIRLWSRSFPQ